MNKILLITCFLGLVALVLMNVGCVANQQYRKSYDPADPSLPGPDVTNAVIESVPGVYSLGFVEFDDQGWFWPTNPANKVLQKNAVLQMIRNEAGFGSSNQCGVIMVLFVHGWKNNAAYENTNVGTFRSVLKQLSEVEHSTSAKEGRNPRKLIGIYAGWRGLSESIEPFKELSFWGRKNAAQRVGSYGAMTELMMDLELLQRSSNESLPTNAAQTKLIIVGHSFGADVVYNALSQIITERFVDTIETNRVNVAVLKPLGDQVILLNPAFEAARVYDLKQLARSVTNYSADQRPVLSIFQSKGDWATHYVFPVGQCLGTLGQSYQSPFQKESNHRTVGWFQPFLTHELIYDTNAAAVLKPDGINDAMATKTLRPAGQAGDAAANIKAQRKIWHEGTSETNVFGSCVLRSVKDYQAHNPILVVSVDTQIMKDHNDIANPVLINFLQEYIPFCDN